MVLAKEISPGKRNADWEFAGTSTVMVSKDGECKYDTIQQAATDLESLGGVYLHYEIIRIKKS
jgi:hypothetical protein